LKFDHFGVENSTKLQKLALEGEIIWVASSHLGQWHKPE
jgi:hypothetical protein